MKMYGIEPGRNTSQALKKTKTNEWTEQKVVWQAYVKAMVTAHESCTQGELEQQQC